MLTAVVRPSIAVACPNEAARYENLSQMLSDCRGYEAVSPLDAPDEVYLPNTIAGEQNGDFYSNEPFRASADGAATTYGGDPLAVGGTGTRGNLRGNEFLASRGGDAWHASDIQPSGEGETASEAQQSVYQGVTFGAVLGVFGAISQPLAATSQPRGPLCTEGTGALYAREPSGSHRPLFTVTETPGQCGHPLFVAASADGSQVFLQTEAALASGAIENPNSGHREIACPLNCNVYDSASGKVSAINVLPDGSAAPHATAGGSPLEGEANEEEPDLGHAVSADGSRVYWTDEETGVIYLRRNPAQLEDCAVLADACTVRVSGVASARYWTATLDGRYAYYTEAGALWRFDAEGGAGHEREELIEGGDEVQGVLGINEEGPDGGYLYIVAGGALPDTGATARICAKAESSTPEEEKERNDEEEDKLPAHRGCNLYLLRGAEATLVATLGPRDNYQESAGSGNGIHRFGGDWRPSLGRRTAQATPDGHTIVFQSILPLTKYDTSALKNVGSSSTEKYIEVFVYNADTAQLSCASCVPSNEPPVGVLEPRTTLPISNSATYMRRWVSADGSRVFFETSQPLLSVDSNSVQDVYEWERQGSGGCLVGSSIDGTGCVYLLSGGRGAPEEPGTLNRASASALDASFTEASESGDDVFFATRIPLVPGAGYETKRLYDARVGGGFPVPTESPSCVGEACRGPSIGPPAGQASGSSVFSGFGNFAPPAPQSSQIVKAKTAAQIKAEKLAKALKACRAKKNKQKRTLCRRRARRRYGPQTAKKLPEKGSKSRGHKSGSNKGRAK